MTKEEFLHDVKNNDLNHRILLWEAMKLTSGHVVEFGSGHGSTPELRKHCKDERREFLSLDNNAEWANVTGATLIKDWNDLPLFKDVDVLFIDHAPGEDRKVRIIQYANLAKILVVHDTEPAQEHGYQMRKYLAEFKYRVEIVTNGAEATMVSNFIDLSSTIGQGNEHYTIVNGR